MHPEIERITWRTLAGFLVLAAVIALIAVPVGLWVGPGERVVVVRLAAALFATVVFSRLARVVRDAARIGMMSRADAATEMRTAPSQPDPLLLRIGNECRIGLRWHVMPAALQQRLCRLCLERGLGIPAALATQPARRATWHDAERILGTLERSE